MISMRRLNSSCFEQRRLLQLSRPGVRCILTRATDRASATHHISTLDTQNHGSIEWFHSIAVSFEDVAQKRHRIRDILPKAGLGAPRTLTLAPTRRNQLPARER